MLLVGIFVNVAAQFELEGADTVLESYYVEAGNCLVLGGVEVFASCAGAVAREAFGKGRVASCFSLFNELSGLDNKYLMGGMRNGSPGDNGNMLLVYGRFEWMALHSHDWILELLVCWPGGRGRQSQGPGERLLLHPSHSLLTLEVRVWSRSEGLYGKVYLQVGYHDVAIWCCGILLCASGSSFPRYVSECGRTKIGAEYEGQSCLIS